MEKKNREANKVQSATNVYEETNDPNENKGSENGLSVAQNPLQIRNDSNSRTTSGSTVVYTGSDARVEIASPFSEADAIDAQQPVVYNSNRPIEVPEAYLVESTARTRSAGFWSHARRLSPIAIAVEAEPIDVQPWYKKRWGKIMIVMFALMVLAVVLMSVFISQNIHDRQASGNAESNVPITNSSPSSSPTHAPTHDPRPTLQVVRVRNVLRCGIGRIQNSTSEDVTFAVFSEEWVSGMYRFVIPCALLMCKYNSHSTPALFNTKCRAIASVVLNDPNKIERVLVDATDRFIRLNKGDIDVLLRGDTYTLQREAREVSHSFFAYLLDFEHGITKQIHSPQLVWDFHSLFRTFLAGQCFLDRGSSFSVQSCNQHLMSVLTFRFVWLDH